MMMRSKRRNLAVAIAVLVGLACAVTIVLRRFDRFVGNAPVRCYGRVVDEHGAGIQGVRVAADLSSIRWDSYPTVPRFSHRTMTAVSDEQGRFSFQATSGKFLSLGPFEKAGWVPSVEGFRRVELGFEYPLLGYEYPPGKRKRPDNPDDPIVYPMVRAGNPAS